MPDWLKDPDKILPGVTAVIGFLLAKLYDLFLADRFASQSTLLVKLKAQTLSQDGKRRLGKDLISSIINLQSKFKRARQNAGAKVDEVAPGDCYYAKQLSDDPRLNACPTDMAKQYFLFYDAENIGHDIIYDLKEVADNLQTELSDYFDGTHSTEKDIFGAWKNIDKDVQLILWVHASNFFPKDQSFLNSNFELLDKVVRKFIPGTQLVVELYLPASLKSKNLGLIKNTRPDTAPVSLAERNKSFELMLFRDQAEAEIKNGIVFGSLNYVHEQIPDEVIFERREAVRHIGLNQIFNLYGSPGTGKTFLLEKLMTDFQKENKGVFLVINSVNVVTALINGLIIDSGQEQFYQSALDIITDGKYNFLPSYYTVDAHTLKITRFILGNILITQSQTLYLVFDDYYLYKEIIQKLVVTIIEKNWQVRFILAGRPRTDDLMDRYPAKVNSYECESWNRKQAIEILKSWSMRDDFEIESAFNFEILVKQDRFSVYLLRLIINNIKNIKGETLSDILRKEIINSLNPVYSKLIGANNQQKISNTDLIAAVQSVVSTDAPDETVEQIKNRLAAILAKKTTIDIDTFIDSIGELSWASRFQYNSGSLGNELVKQHLPYLDIEEFFSLGSEANIFKTDNGTYSRDWNDNLIADGCLSLLLRRNLEKIKNDSAKYKQFSGKLDGLRDQNSLNILSLVLDNNDIISLTKIISHTNLDRIDIIDELLSEQQIDKLKSKNQLGSLVMALIEGLRNNNDAAHIFKVTRFIKKLADLDAPLRLLLKESLGTGRTMAEVAEFWLALEEPDNNSFFEQLDKLGIDRSRSTKIAIQMRDDLKHEQIVARLTTLRAGQQISQESFDELWTIYLGKLNFVSLTEFIKATFSPLDEEAKVYISLLKVSLRMLRSKKNKEDRMVVREHIKDLLTTCFVKKQYMFCKEFVKMSVFIDHPILVFDKVDWAINIDEKFAVPIYPYGAQPFREIAASLPENLKYFIPRKKHILMDGNFTDILEKFDGFEIVADSLSGPNFHVQPAPSSYKLINFRSSPLMESYATRPDIQNGTGARSFFWRPLFYF